MDASMSGEGSPNPAPTMNVLSAALMPCER